MPIMLAQQIEGINQTLDLIKGIGTIESIPGAMLVMGVLFFLGMVTLAFFGWRMISTQSKVFEKYNEGQKQAAETNQSNYIVERDVTAAKLDALTAQAESTNRIIEGYHNTLQGLTEQMSQTAQYLAETARALKALEQRVVASEAEAIDRWTRVETVGKELKTNMGELENGNQKILDELRIIRNELKRVADSVESAMENLIAAVDTITKPVPPQPDDKPDDSE